MMGSTGGNQTAARKEDDKLTIDNLWKILATEKEVSEAVMRLQQTQQKERSRSRSGLYEPVQTQQA